MYAIVYYSHSYYKYLMVNIIIIGQVLGEVTTLEVEKFESVSTPLGPS